MKRRNFLRNIPLAVMPSLLGTNLTAYANSPLLTDMGASLFNTDRVLVIIQLFGGNDGLNTVIPLDQYQDYSAVRGGLAIPQNSILKLTTKTGLHPSMTAFQSLFNEGRLAIVQNVGYPNFNFSHFRSTDIWSTGSDESETWNSGWIGRYLNYEYPNYPNGFPNTTMPDPLAIRLGGNVDLGLQHLGQGMGIAISDDRDGLDLSGYIYKDPAPNNKMGTELKFIREAQRQTDKFGDVIQNAANKQPRNLSTLYPTSSFGAILSNQLKIVARLIAGGLKTRIYWVSLGGFDTHANQLAGHAELLKGVSNSVYAFLDDCKRFNIADRVTGFTFSEFGRRIKANGSDGTDHGAAAPMFVFGNKVNGQLLGTNPKITAATVDAASNIPMQYDYRSIYASILQNWFCVPNQDMNSVMGGKNFSPLPLIKTPNCIPSVIHDDNNSAGYDALMASPNPFQEATTVRYKAQGGHTMIQIFNNQGVVIATPVDTFKEAGDYEVRCDLGYMASGVYYVRLQSGEVNQVKSLLKIR